MTKRLILPLLMLLVAGACAGSDPAVQASGDISDRKVKVTTTTNFITDVAKQIGGDRVEVSGLMGPGVDPHLYKPSAGDVEKFSGADIIFYGGLELEGRMSDLLVEMASERKTVPVTKDIPEDQLLEPAEFAGKFDPHVWFDVQLWKHAVGTIRDTYIEVDPANEEHYRGIAEAYLAELDELHEYVVSRVAEIPETSRVLVTSHDAFNYFGRAYGFQVEAIQGISTETEATTGDIERIAALLAERKIKAVFVESSVPRQTIEAVVAAAKSRGWDAKVGGELFSDAAGSDGTPEGTYLGMVRHNIDLVTEGLK